MGAFLLESNKWLLYPISVILSMLLCMSAIPRIIYISKKKKIFDQPDSYRKVHTDVIPNLGGIAIFLGFSVIASLFINPEDFAHWNYIIAAILILFITGIKDDLINVNPSKKFIAQIAASSIVAVLADYRLENLHGFLGIYEMPYTMSLFVTIVGCTFISNAFNLIDGIDGLAGTIAIICSFFLGIAFAITGNYSPAIISFALLGAVIGFLRYNYQPAKIFMGDSGSLVIGFIIAVLSIILTDVVKHFEGNILFHSPKAVLLGALSLLFIPVFDTFRVFTTRIIKGKSPFSADRTHLHHYLLDLGFSHTRTVIILALSSLAIISIAFAIQDYPVNLCLLVIILSAFALFSLLYFLRRNKLSEHLPPVDAPKKNKLIL
ncbi:MAG: MraY family glycosyltransferase [Chitinophagaceae bacterium]|jgi:UDP-N-acetylmuramyl pentapeptide phosphotransferase/UDP-N-acetylglucosamine-1-phosphate transferase